MFTFSPYSGHTMRENEVEKNKKKAPLKKHQSTINNMLRHMHDVNKGETEDNQTDKDERCAARLCKTDTGD